MNDNHSMQGLATQNKDNNPCINIYSDDLIARHTIDCQKQSKFPAACGGVVHSFRNYFLVALFSSFLLSSIIIL
jgi:hypothetical protein